ncbi:hypothetical protein Bca52824_015894 [Brassica carinata]|uniref:Uncharacterized protein n=1 Tax=Brassica carinata TaxID=52824 RepID=A0A8X7W3G7_BRACI|nr:hypothetical protein Bca52824_015894 [Brassica carinata]
MRPPRESQDKGVMEWKEEENSFGENVGPGRAVILGESSSGPGKRWGHTCSAVKGGTFLYIFGGYGTDNCQTNQVHVFDAAKQIWTQPMVSGTPPPPRDSHSCTTVGDNLILHKLESVRMLGGKDLRQEKVTAQCSLTELEVRSTTKLLKLLFYMSENCESFEYFFICTDSWQANNASARHRDLRYQVRQVLDDKSFLIRAAEVVEGCCTPLTTSTSDSSCSLSYLSTSD